MLINFAGSLDIFIFIYSILFSSNNFIKLSYLSLRQNEIINPPPPAPEILPTKLFFSNIFIIESISLFETHIFLSKI